MLRDCPWSEKRWDCSKVVQDDVKKKTCVGEKEGGGGVHLWLLWAPTENTRYRLVFCGLSQCGWCWS